MEGVAQALTWAINDPSGHSSWNTSVCHKIGFSSTLKTRRPRGQKETMQAATVFDSSAIPPIGIDKYLLRLSATFRCSDATFIAALIMVDRLLGYDGGRLPLTMRNVHRVFLASLVVAVKYHEDLVYSNSHYAKAGGVHLREVNRLERTLLVALDFDLRVAPEEYRMYEASLASLSSSSPPKEAPPVLPGAGSISQRHPPASTLAPAGTDLPLQEAGAGNAAPGAPGPGGEGANAAPAPPTAAAAVVGDGAPGGGGAYAEMPGSTAAVAARAVAIAAGTAPAAGRPVPGGSGGDKRRAGTGQTPAQDQPSQPPRPPWRGERATVMIQ